MKHKILYLLAFLLITVCSCSSDDAVEAGAPTVQFPLSELNVDLNTVDNLPIIAVIKSEAGLAQVNVDIKSEDGLVHFKSITDFYNIHNYSLAESPEYKVSYTSVVVEAIDLQGKKVSAEMPITVKDIISRPVVTFENDEILYDEMDENAVMPRTKFTVQAEGGLKLVEIFRVFKGGQEKLASMKKNGETSYDFDDLINYTENDKAIKIIASDAYNNATVATLPVVYKIVPVPVVTVPAEPVFAESAKDVKIPVAIDAIRGLKNVKLYKVEDGEETLLKTTPLDGKKQVNTSIPVKLSQATSHVKVVVSDGREGKEVSALVKTYVDMKVKTLNVGSHPLANTGHKDFDNSYGLVSLKDMKTYSVDYAVTGDNSANIDFKFYRFGKDDTSVRLYSMDNTEKDGEFKGSNGATLKSITKKCMTRFVIKNDLNYEDATVASLKKVLNAEINQNKLTPFKAGDIIVFRTGSASTSGGGKIGVMKVIKLVDNKTLGFSDPRANILVVEIKMPTK